MIDSPFWQVNIFTAAMATVNDLRPDADGGGNTFKSGVVLHFDPHDCNPGIFTKKRIGTFRPPSVASVEALECSYVSLKQMIPVR